MPTSTTNKNGVFSPFWRSAGLVWFIPWLDAIQTVDLRMFFNIWPQEVSSILWSLKAVTHWPLFPYKDHICVHLACSESAAFLSITVWSYLFLHIDVSSPLPAFCCHQVLTVDAVLLCFSPFMWVMSVVNGPQTVFLLAQTTLKTMIGSHTLEDVLTQKLAMVKRMEVSETQ